MTMCTRHTCDVCNRHIQFVGPLYFLSTGYLSSHWLNLRHLTWLKFDSWLRSGQPSHNETSRKMWFSTRPSCPPANSIKQPFKNNFKHLGTVMYIDKTYIYIHIYISYGHPEIDRTWISPKNPHQNANIFEQTLRTILYLLQDD